MPRCRHRRAWGVPGGPPFGQRSVTLAPRLPPGSSMCFGLVGAPLASSSSRRDVSRASCRRQHSAKELLFGRHAAGKPVGDWGAGGERRTPGTGLRLRRRREKRLPGSVPALLVLEGKRARIPWSLHAAVCEFSEAMLDPAGGEALSLNCFREKPEGNFAALFALKFGLASIG